MEAIYRIVRKTFRFAVPTGVKQVLWRQRDSTLGRLAYRFKEALEKTGSHDAIYDKYYYNDVDRFAIQSAVAIAESVMNEFRPANVVDVGCGTGALLTQFKKCHVSALGLERSAAAIKICGERNLEVFPFDLEAVSEYAGRADVAICLEVAEHLPERFADRLVKLLCDISDHVVFTAATPGQGGTDHLNEQPHEYWIEKFSRRGFNHDVEISGAWRRAWQARTASFYSDNIMVFNRRPPR